MADLSQDRVVSNNQKLYNNLLKSGKVTQDEIGDFNTFNTLLSDSSNASKLRDNLISKKNFSEADLGSHDDFLQNLDPLEGTTNKPEKTDLEYQQDWVRKHPKLNALFQKEGMGLLNDAYIGTKKMIGSFGTTIDVMAENLGNNLTGGYQTNEKGEVIAPWEKEYKQPGKSDFAKKIEQFEKEVPASKGGFTAFFGQMLPQVTGLIATTLLRNKSVSEAYLASMYGTSFGSGIENYDKHIKETGETPNANDRNLVGIGYGAAEYLGEKVGLDYFMPKGYGKLTSGAINPIAAKEIGKNVIENYAKLTKQSAPMILKKIIAGSQIEGGQEVATEGIDIIIDKWVTGEDITGEDVKSRLVDAYKGGVFMSAGVMPFAHISQNVSTTQRRRQQGEVTIGIDEKGLPLEIIKTENGIIGIRPNGDEIGNISEQTIKNSATFKTEDFEKTMSSLKKGSDVLSEDWKDESIKQNLLNSQTEGQIIVNDVSKRVQAKKEFEQASASFNDIPNANYTEAVKNLLSTYTDPKEIITNFNKISSEIGVEGKEYETALKFLSSSVKVNSLNKAKQAEIQKGIDDFQDDKGNVTSAEIEGEKYYIKNSADLGQPGRIIFAKNQKGEVKPFNASLVKNWSTLTPDQITQTAQQKEAEEDNQFNTSQEVSAAASQVGIEPNKSVKTPNGIAKVVSVNNDGTVTVVNQKGLQDEFSIDEVEAYKTEEQKQAEKEALTQQQENEKIQLQQQEDTAEQEAKIQQQAIEQQSTETTPEQPSIPKDKDGNPDYDAMDPEVFFNEYAKEFSEEEAKTEIQDMQRAIIEDIKKKTTKKSKATSANERAAIAREIKSLNTRLDNINGVLQKDRSKTDLGSDTKWIAKNSSNPDEIVSAYEQEKSNAPVNNLKEWQKFITGVKFNPDSFNRFGDKNNITSTLAKTWLNSEGHDIDQFIRDNFEDVPGFEDVTEQDVIDFITENPTGQLRKTTDTQNELRKRYREITGVSIDNHKFDNETLPTQAKLESFLTENNLNDSWFTTEDLQSLVTENKDKLNENDYNEFTDYLSRELTTKQSELDEWDFDDAESSIQTETSASKDSDSKKLSSTKEGEPIEFSQSSLLNEAPPEVKSTEGDASIRNKKIIEAHRQIDSYILQAQTNYDEAQAERYDYIQKNGYPIGEDATFHKLVVKTRDAEDRLNKLLLAKENLLPLPNVANNENKQSESEPNFRVQDKSEAQQTIEYLQSIDKSKRNVIYLGKSDIIQYLEDNRHKYSRKTIDQVKNANFSAFYLRDEIFINSDKVKTKEDVDTNWIHERVHAQTKETLNNEELSLLYDQIGLREIQRIIPHLYWLETPNIQADEYISFASEKLLANGKLDDKIPSDIQNIILNIVNNITSINNLTNGKNNLDNFQQGIEGRNAYVGDSDRRGTEQDRTDSEGNGVGSGTRLRPDEKGSKVTFSDQANIDLKDRHNAIASITKIGTELNIPVNVVNSSELTSDNGQTALTDNGTVTIVSDRVKSVSEVIKALVKEVAGEKGIREILANADPNSIVGKQLAKYDELSPEELQSDKLAQVIRKAFRLTSNQFTEEDLNDIIGGKAMFRTLSENENLVALHNISEENINMAKERKGRLITPSLAIVQKGVPFTDFGMITLIGTKEMIDPEASNVKVFKGDVYSPTVPRPQYEVDKRTYAAWSNSIMQKAYSPEYSEIANKVANVVEDFGSFRKEIARSSAESVKNNLEKDMRIVYILEKGIDFKVPMKPKPFYISNNYDIKLTPEELQKAKTFYERFRKETHNSSLELTDETRNLGYDFIRQSILRDTREKYSNWDNREQAEQLAQDHAESAVDRANLTFLSDKIGSLISGKTELDSDKYNKLKDNLFKKKAIQDDYSKWLDEKINQFQGRKYFEKGNEKLSYTTENLVEATTGHTRAQEKGMTYGMNKAKASAIKQLKNIDEIRKAQQDLVTKEEMTRIEKELQEKYFEIANGIKYKWKDTFGKYDDFGKSLADYFKGYGANQALVRNDFIPSNYNVDEFKDFANELKNSPIDYLEAKTQRAVDLNEFKYAVVPETTRKETIQTLKENGIKVKKYSEYDERTNIIKQIADKDREVRFRILGETGASNLDKAEEVTTRLDNLKVAREMEGENPLDKYLQSYLEKGSSLDNEELLYHYGLKRFNLQNKYGFAVLSLVQAKEYGKGSGTRVMNDLIRWADKNKISIALTPDTSFGATSTSRLKEFYKRFGFVENKGKNKEWNTKEGLIRNPHEHKQFTPQQIRLATGWEKGVDGKWRYETPDGKLLGQALKDTKDGYGSSFEAKLSQVIDDDKLFQSYPELKTIKVEFKSGKTEGSYNDSEKKITVSSGAEDKLSVLIHEIQHAIQEIEGFARGGNAMSAATTFTFEEQKERAELIEALPELESMMNDAEFGTETRRSAARSYVAAKKRIEELSARKRYEGLAGEVESRNVQTRMNMSPEERRNALLSETEDVAREDQIVLMDGLGINKLELPETNDYLYHGTSEGALSRIINEGLKTGVNREGAVISLTNSEQYAKSYADRKGNVYRGVILRVKNSGNYEIDNSVKNTSREKDFKTSQNIPIEDIEIKSGNEWIPLNEYDFYEKKRKSNTVPETITINGVERPTTNSKGQLIADSESNPDIRFRVATSKQELDDFVKDSEVKKTVYHGSDAIFEEFDTQSNFVKDFPESVYFSSNIRVSKTYGKNVIKAKINIQNPYYFDADRKTFNQLYDRLRSVFDTAINSGRDGVVITNIYDNWSQKDKTGLGTTYAVFSPDQILIESLNDDIRFRIDKASEEVNTNPTDAQKESGNYKKGHIKFDGFDISIENPKGSTRSGVDQDGNKWSNQMSADYGYIKGTVGKDKDHIDVFIGNKPELNKVYVVDQINPKTGKFDESKVMLGFDGVTEARKAYQASYSKDWKGLNNITRTTKEGLKDWFENGNTKKPFADGDVRFRLAYHGSPHQFDKFTTEKIGTGEGAQAFGWGLYFTDKKSIAEDYANKLRPNRMLIDGKTFDQVQNEIGDTPAMSWVEIWHGDGMTKSQIIDKLNKEISDKDRLIKFPWIEPSVKKTLDYLKDKEITKNTNNSNVYAVELHQGKEPGEYDYLRWDKPISKSQVEKLGGVFNEKYTEYRDYLNSLIKKYGNNSIEMIKKRTPEEKQKMERLLSEYSKMDNDFVGTGETVYKKLSQKLGSDKAASEYLLKQGIDGIQYPTESVSSPKNWSVNEFVKLDGAKKYTVQLNGKPHFDNGKLVSFDSTKEAEDYISKNESFNYVIFDENAVEVKEHVRFRQSEKNTDVTSPDYWKNNDVTYLHNPEPSPYMGARFGQDVEPSGKYVITGHAFIPEGTNEGTVRFKNPLIIDVTDQVYPQWKKELSERFGGKKKKVLTNAILRKGYDGIVTVENYKGKYDTKEIVILDPSSDSKGGARFRQSDITKDLSSIEQLSDIAFKVSQKSANTVPENQNEDTEKAMNKAHGLKGETILSKIDRWKQEVKETAQHFKYVTEKEFPQIYNDLRLFESIPEVVKKDAYDKIADIVRPIANDKNLYKAFERYVVISDLMHDIKSGIYTNTIGIKEAAELKGVSEKEIKDLIESGAIKTMPHEKGQRYQLYYDSVLPGAPKSDTYKQLPFSMKSVDEVETYYNELREYIDKNPSLRKVIANRNSIIYKVRDQLIENNLMSEKARDNTSYFHHMVMKYRENPEKSTAINQSYDVRVHPRGWQKSRTGSMEDYNTDYLQSEFEVIAQSLEQLAVKKSLQKIGQEVDIMPALVAQANNEGGSWRDFVPEGYTTWHPKPGTNAWAAASMAEKAIQSVIEGNPLTESLNEQLAEADQTLWVIPTAIANQLDEMKTPTKEMLPVRGMRFFNSTWKQWILLNPARLSKYMINNLSGDLDIVFAYNPKILQPKYAWTAAKELYNEATGKGMSKDMREAIENAVISSGLSIQEIPDVNNEGVFKTLTGENNLFNKYWNTATSLNDFREGMLRLAAYKFFKEELNAGKIHHGVSNPKAVDALRSNEEKAGKMARELLGDYGNLSQGGVWLRSHAYPFWSWMEINAPRYYKLLRNTYQDTNSAPRTVGAAIRKTAISSTALAARIMLLSALITAWNRLFFPDEDDELTKTGNRQLRLITGRRDDGSIVTLRIQGAFSDVLSFVGLEDAYQDVKDVRTGKTTAGKKVKEAGSAFVNRVGQGAMPFERLTGELITGKSAYPDILHPRPIIDRAEHAFRMVSLDKVYRFMTKKPLKKGGKELIGLVLYETDPGEAAYYAMRQRIYNFLDEKEYERPSGDPTEKSIALRYYKQAKKFKDTKLENHWLAKYKALGGTTQGMKTSIKKGEVTNALPRKYKKEFLDKLDGEDREVLEMAERWYDETYKK